jgi:hypothetical protein
MTITLRTQSATGASTKGSTLTHEELDDNFIDILQNKIRPIDVRGDTGTQLVGQSLSNEILQVVGGTNISTAVTSDSAGQARITITSAADVTGAASSTDNAITRFDSTTGKLIQNSLVTVADDGAITAPSVGSVIPFYFANQAAFPSATTYHGALAHSHSDGKVYFAHSSSWNALANAADAFVPASPGEIGATTPDVGNFTDLKVKAASSVVKELQLHDQDNSNYVGFKAPVTVSTNKVYVMPSTDGTNGQMLTTDGSATLSWTTASTELSTDTTPQLGGDLDMNGQKIVTTSNANIVLQPNGTGDVHLTADTVRVGDHNLDATISSYGTGDLILNTHEGTNSGSIKINSGNNGNIEITPDGTGDVELNADTVRVGDNNANVTITTNGTGDLILNTNAGSNSGRITIEDGSNGDITLAPNGTGRVEILGTANQQASIRLFEELSSAGNNQSTLLQASKFISADITLTLPNTTSTLGYQNLPAVGTKSGSYTLALADIGKYVQVASGGSITIPDSTFAEGDVIVIVNNHTAAITITCTITDAYIGGVDADKATVSLATRGVCNILFVSGTRCIITGNVS